LGGKLCLLVGVRTLPLLRRRHKRTLPFICLLIYIGLVHDKFILFFIIGKAPYFENAPHLMALPYTEYLQLIGDLINSPEDVKLLIDFGVIKNMFW